MSLIPFTIETGNQEDMLTIGMHALVFVHIPYLLNITIFPVLCVFYIAKCIC